MLFFLQLVRVTSAKGKQPLVVVTHKSRCSFPCIAGKKSTGGNNTAS